jgi:hypothetical protein
MAKGIESLANGLAHVSWVARTLERSEQTVREQADKGVLPAIRLPNGTRLFQKSAIERIAAERKK